MSIAHCLRAAVCVLPAAVLTACGGGGGGDRPTSSASPSQVDNYVSVDGGNTTLAAGRHALDTGYAGVSEQFIFDKELLESVSPESPDLDMGMLYAPGTPGKYAIFFGAENTDFTRAFACRSEAWTEMEVQIIEEAIKAEIPPCTSTISIDTTTRRVTFNGLVLQGMNQVGKSVTLSADFAWSPPTPSFVSKVVIEAGSTLATWGDYAVTGRNSGSSLEEGLELGFSELVTDHPLVRLFQTKEQDGRFALRARTQDESSATYACISAGWTSTDTQKLERIFKSPLSICPSSVSYDAKTRLLTLGKATLPSLNNSGYQLVLSLKYTMPEPGFSISTNPSSPSPAVPPAPIPAPVTPPMPSSGF